MWRQEGFQGFMKGNGINVVRVGAHDSSSTLGLIRPDTSLLGVAIYRKLDAVLLSMPKLIIQSYGTFKSVLANWSGEESLSAPLRLLAGAGAGIVAVCRLM